MALYVYDIDSGNVLLVIHGSSNEACESKANELGLADEELGWSYSDSGLSGVAAAQHIHLT